MRIDTSPADVGMDDSKFGLLRQSIERDIEKGISDASIILIARYGKIVMHEAIGYSDKRKGRVAKTDDVLPVMSLTKQLVAGAVFRFIDRGQLALTTRVAEVIPEFGKRGKERVTIRQLLSHQAGLAMQHPLEDWRDGNEAYVAKICERPLEPAPEGVANYHAGAAHAVLGEIMRRLDTKKRSIHQILKEELFVPTGMADTGLTLKGRSDLLARLAPIAMRDDSPDALPPRDVEQMPKFLPKSNLWPEELSRRHMTNSALPRCSGWAERSVVFGFFHRRSSRRPPQSNPGVSFTASSWRQRKEIIPIHSRRTSVFPSLYVEREYS